MARVSPVDLQKALSGTDYPTDREALVECAKRNHASKEITEELSHLRKKTFDNPAEVSKAVFGHK
ncbi:DUF2795 domain-containing protein [Streptomyces sp. NPDC052051]|uniref:DUF2795 domain-containing protein n=1 Tax=Streptomyces macrolidinus TaxID=2952607 RepID=A0ABT0ZIU1_9ACTN|nr:DUF2795 domain-containing protein [Streptomyces macrolidinus]MCN9243513.1 DUF2795 domain-containing protein [Streptomyces macrolidinus]